MHFKDRATVTDGNLVSFNAGILQNITYRNATLSESGFMKPPYQLSTGTHTDLHTHSINKSHTLDG